MIYVACEGKPPLQALCFFFFAPPKLPGVACFGVVLSRDGAMRLRSNYYLEKNLHIIYMYPPSCNLFYPVYSFLLIFNDLVHWVERKRN